MAIPESRPSTSSSSPRQLVGARNGPLEINAQHVANIAKAAEKMRKLHAELQQKSPSLFTAFDSSKTPTDWEVAEQVKIVVIASISELSISSQDSDALDTEIAKLEQLVEIWEGVSEDLEATLVACRSTQTLDLKSIENLTLLMSKVQAIGIPTNCHSSLL